MKKASAICLCGHWDNKHDECDWKLQRCKAAGHGEAWHATCTICGCANFQIDRELMQSYEEHARQLQWDADHDK